MDVEKRTEFPEERKGVIVELESVAWHTKNLLCPFCMEKHASLVNGLSGEIADGEEGDQEIYRKLSEEASDVIDRLQRNKQVHAFTDAEVNFYRDWSRAWRRKLSGASADGHNHAEHIEQNHSIHKNHVPLEEMEETEIKSHHSLDEEKLFARCIQGGGTAKECKTK